LTVSEDVEANARARAVDKPIHDFRCDELEAAM
jgi:hypothetical protein